MERMCLAYLKNWLGSKDRKPLIIRGARQVGKTWIARELATKCKLSILEINFEKNLQLQTLFNSSNPKEIILGLSAALNQAIEPQKSLLFLDEIQAAPEILAKLRWFAEDLPELPVIAAGSLLEFTLEETTFSMPVGRVSYMYLEPLSFEEFLLANSKEPLLTYLQQYEINFAVPQAIHQQLSELFKEYIIIGGMPAIVKNWVFEKSLPSVAQISHDLISTYRNDFGKYRGRLSIEKLDEVLISIPAQLGCKFVYSHVDRESNAASIKQALRLLNKALISHPIMSTAANGVPLGAEINEKSFKEIFLDVGLCSTILGIMLNQVKKISEISLINKGGIAEQVVGQLLRTINPPYIEPQLYYWQREKKGSEAEIDYLIQHGNQVVPIEIKAGSTGSLKSLHLFMDTKKLPLAVRFNSEAPNITKVNVIGQNGTPIQYTLVSLPFYLIEQLTRILTSL